MTCFWQKFCINHISDKNNQQKLSTVGKLNSKRGFLQSLENIHNEIPVCFLM